MKTVLFSLLCRSRQFNRMLLLCLLLIGGGAHAQLQVIESLPLQGSSTVDPFVIVQLTFDRSLDTLSVTPASVRISGEFQGPYGFTWEYRDSTNLLRIFSLPVFMPGELISITLPAGGLRGTDGSSLAAPLVISFRTNTRQGLILGPTIAPLQFDLFPGDQQPARIAAGDFNRDAYPDAAVISSSSNTLTIMINRILANGIPSLQSVSSYPTGRTPVDLAAADFDEDGHLDIVVANFNEDNIKFFWGDGNGAFSAFSTINVGNRPSGLAVADFYGGDGRSDLAVALFGEDRVRVYRNDGGRQFALVDELICEESTFDIDARDFNGDGAPDIAAINNGAKSLSIFRNMNGAAWQAYGALPLPSRPLRVRWEDVSSAAPGGDGTAEVLVLTGDLTLIGDQPSVLAPGSRITIFQYDEGADAFAVSDSIDNDGNALAFDIANMDYNASGDPFNGDLDLDLLLPDYTGNNLQYLQNEDFRGWSSPFDTLAGTPNPRDLITVDVDRDGDLDVLFANHLTNQVGLLLSYPFDIDLQFPDSVIDFGDVFVGDRVDTLSQYDPSAAIDLQVQAQILDPVNFDVQPRNFAVRSGQPAPVTFSFLPQDTLSFLTVSSFFTDHPLQQDPVTVLLLGRGVYVEIVVEPALLDFGVVPPSFSRTLTFTIRNRGNTDLDLSGFQNRLAAFTHNGLPGSIPPRGRQVFSVTFAPLAVGAYRDTLFIDSNDRITPRTGVVLIGRSSLDAPLITSADTVTAIEDIYFSYLATAVDPDNTPVSFRFANLPSWLQADADSVFGTPREGDRDTTFRVIASDGFLEDTLDVYVIVIPVNDPPVIAPIPDQQLLEQERLTLAVSASDEEGEALRLTAAGLPAGAQFVDNGDNSGTFDWTPPFGSAGDYTVTFQATETVSNPALSGSATVNINVIRRAPDIVVSDLQVLQSPVFANQTVPVIALISNREAPVAAPFRVVMSADGSTFFDSTFSAMAVDQAVTIRGRALFPREGAVPVVAEADIDAVISEQNEGNNRQSITVDVQPGLVIVRPNPFTPNDDNRNDATEFDLENIGAQAPQIEIFDLAGRRVRALSAVVNNRLRWDGRSDSGEAQAPGVYLYVLKDGGRRIARGTVVLAR